LKNDSIAYRPNYLTCSAFFCLNAFSVGIALSKKSQAAFEYMVLVAGVMLIVVIGTLAFRAVFQSPVESVQASNCWLRLAADSNCYVGS